jgi:hypothetical protein
MYTISALGLRGLFSSRIPRENHADPLRYVHPTLETTALHDKDFQLLNNSNMSVSKPSYLRKRLNDSFSVYF